MDTWISYDTDKVVKTEDIYAKKGIEPFKVGLPLREGLKALILFKRTLWLFVMDESNCDSIIELNQMSVLNDRVFFLTGRNTILFEGIWKS